MIVGIMIVFYSTVTETSLATLFPSLPQEIKDLDLGLAVIIINIVVTLGVSAVTRKSVNRVEEEADISHIAR
jgi:SSS family solute:Na+ symporter